MRIGIAITWPAFFALTHCKNLTTKAASSVSTSTGKVVDRLFGKIVQRASLEDLDKTLFAKTASLPTSASPGSLRSVRAAVQAAELGFSALTHLKTKPPSGSARNSGGAAFGLYSGRSKRSIFGASASPEHVRKVMPVIAHKMHRRQHTVGQALSPSARHESEAPPVTILGGFLGTGKTTALTHLLTNRAGLRIAVLVNDVAAVNVDAATMRRRTAGTEGVEMFELENGCACCGPGAGALVPAVRSLVSARDEDHGSSAAFDHVVVELSGVADPANVQRNLRQGGVEVTRKVALVDANAFPGLYNSRSRVSERMDLADADVTAKDPCTVDRKVVELLLQQIETADIILVNKCDLASADELRTTLAACRALNPNAKMISTTYGDAQLQDILPLTQNEITTKHPGDVKGSIPEGSLSSDPPGVVPNSVEELRFQTYVYRARRPFALARIESLVQSFPVPQSEVLSTSNIGSPGAKRSVEDVILMSGKDQTFANVLRSKGTLWLDVEHRNSAEWAHAGRHLQIRMADAWWATLPREIMRAALSSSGTNTTVESKAYKKELANFPSSSAGSGQGAMSDFGDRRQEIVFIGIGLDKSAIERALDSCLVTEPEMQEYRARWGPEDLRIAAANGPFRFAAGTRVECNMDVGWKQGVIVKQYYREPDWPAAQWMPYQILLDDGGELIWAPLDRDEVIRRV